MNFTPLRYPGGKQRLSPFVQQILIENDIKGKYCEPFAGGAGVAFYLLLKRQVEEIYINDSFLGVYAFWHSIKFHNEALIKRIKDTPVTMAEWYKAREAVKKLDSSDLFELGFYTFFLNRTNRSGVLSAGVIGGLDQTGNYKMDARFNISDLIDRIRTLSYFVDQIHISNLDAEEYIKDVVPTLGKDSLTYFDPPYYNKANQLYLNWYKPGDHKSLSHAIQGIETSPWILSYDGVPEILDLYQERRSFLYDLQYSAARSYKGREVFVFDDTIKIPEACGLKNVDEGLASLVA